jgi:hypothetical protein
MEKVSEDFDEGLGRSNQSALPSDPIYPEHFIKIFMQIHFHENIQNRKLD